MKKHFPGFLLTVALSAIGGSLGYKLITSHLLPQKLSFLLLAVIVLSVMIAAVMTWNTKRRILFSFGVFITMVLALVLGASRLLFDGAVDAIIKITSTKTETANVCVYVMADDPAESIQDAQGYIFGILGDMDRENTDHAVGQIQKDVGNSLTLSPYSGVTKLAESFLKGECRAIIINSAYLDILAELPEYSNIRSQIRQIHVEVVKQTVPNSRPGDSSGSTVVNENVFKMYISGIDTYGDISSRSRSDVNIIAVVNTATHQILLISTPRDYYVPLSVSDGIPDKLTHAGIYGVQVSMDTLGMLYDTNIDYYFRVNFDGFESIVDALGGITVYSDYGFTTIGGVHSFVAGENQVNGEQALAFARERYAFAEGDIQRGKNQMQVIKAVVKKLCSPAILSDYSSLMEALTGSFETSIPYDVLAGLAREQLESGDGWEIITCNVTGYSDYQIPYSLSDYAYVMIPDEESVEFVKGLINSMERDERITQP